MQEVKRISFSELKNWKECPYRHKLIHVDKLPYFEGNEYTAFGTAIHLVCEKIIPKSEENALSIFENAFLEELRHLKEQGKELNSDLVSSMRSQAAPICEQVIPAVKSHFGDFEVISSEEQLLEPIREFDSKGRHFKGFIDMVIKRQKEKWYRKK